MSDAVRLSWRLGALAAAFLLERAMTTVTLQVSGMTCQGCVRSVTRVLQSIPGVSQTEVALDKGQATVTFDPAQASVDTLKAAIEEAGYEAA